MLGGFGVLTAPESFPFGLGRGMVLCGALPLLASCSGGGDPLSDSVSSRPDMTDCYGGYSNKIKIIM